MRKILLLLLLFQFIATDIYAKLYITTQEVKVRRGSGTKFDMYYKLKRGDTVEQTEVDGHWVKIIYHEKEGYVPAKVLREIAEDGSIPEEKASGDDDSDPYADLDPKTLAGLVGVIGLIAGARKVMEHMKKKKKVAGVSETPALQAKPGYWYVCKNCNEKQRALSTPSKAYCLKAEEHEWINLGETGNINYHCKHCGVTVLTSKVPRERDCPSASMHTWTNLGPAGTKHYYCKDCGITIMSADRPAEINCSHSEVHAWAEL